MTPPGTERRHKPFVPEGMQMSEFTMRALFIGLVMTIVLGAANAYLGLRAGIGGANVDFLPDTVGDNGNNLVPVE